MEVGLIVGFEDGDGLLFEVGDGMWQYDEYFQEKEFEFICLFEEGDDGGLFFVVGYVDFVLYCLQFEEADVSEEDDEYEYGNACGDAVHEVDAIL